MNKYPLLKLILIILIFGANGVNTHAQEAQTYQNPPKSIADLVNAPPTPIAGFSKSGDFMLLLESHGYAAKESILHTLYEQHQWLEKWVKNKDTGKINLKLK